MAKRLRKPQVIKRVKEILDIKTSLREEDGDYFCEIYADHRDELGRDCIKRIFTKDREDRIFDEFYQVINEAYAPCDCDEFSAIMKTIEQHFDDEDDGVGFEAYRDMVSGWLNEHLHFDYPYDHYKGQDVCINILIDTGDANYDFACNNLFNFYRDNEACNHIDPASSLLWIVMQQGYSGAQTKKLLRDIDDQGSQFLASVISEGRNSSSAMNALAFLVKMPLEKAMELHGQIKSGKGNIVIDKSATCGLLDLWSGSGSVLEIELERDVVLPVKFVDSALPDGMRGPYSVSEIYGVDDSVWSDEVVRVETCIAA